jgi:UDP-N-acetylglucosamine diphosphorylase / glucose-1-phosphate thymidylyltransferase / UDP-N-acetylgalactosamine diphosphorylase / glucosamine-1-phosphate N-acetyltransferase / galactosamine-1-phosphate N-acetyltransferase
MERIIIRAQTTIPPFAEPARDLRILNKPLWLLQRDLLKMHCKGSTEIESIDEIYSASTDHESEILVHRDNLFFNARLIDAFISTARASKRPCQIAFRAGDPVTGRGGDPSIVRHALQLSQGFTRRDGVERIIDGEVGEGDVYIADLYYFPPGRRDAPVPLVIDTQSQEMGYYHIPSYMASQGDLTFQIPIRAFLSIESWLHIFMANIIMGVFSWAATEDVRMTKARLKHILRWTAEDWEVFPSKLAFSAKALWERINPFEEQWRNHFYASRAMVKVGKRCSIDPTAVIHGPTLIGDDVNIGPGVVISNSLIGNNVTIMQGSQIMLSVISDRCYLPFNGGLFMTSLMENTMVAQNSTLQLCVLGRNTFVGANNVFTDFNLQGEPIKIIHHGRPTTINLPVLGSAVGHNCKIGSGFVVYPGRMIESNAVIIFDNERNLIRKTVPGHDLDDVDQATGEPRRIVYHWPNVYSDPSATADDSSDSIETRVAGGSTYTNGHGSQPAVRAPSSDAPPAHIAATRGG